MKKESHWERRSNLCMANLAFTDKKNLLETLIPLRSLKSSLSKTLCGV